MAFKGVALGLVEANPRHWSSPPLAGAQHPLGLPGPKQLAWSGQTDAPPQPIPGTGAVYLWQAHSIPLACLGQNSWPGQAKPMHHPSQPPASCPPTPSLVPANPQPRARQPQASCQPTPSLGEAKPWHGTGPKRVPESSRKWIGKVDPFPAHKSRRMR